MTEPVSMPKRRAGLRRIAEIVRAHYALSEEAFAHRVHGSEARKVAALVMLRTYPDALSWEIGEVLGIRAVRRLFWSARHDPVVVAEALEVSA